MQRNCFLLSDAVLNGRQDVNDISKPKFLIFLILVSVGVVILNMGLREALDRFGVPVQWNFIGGGTTGAALFAAILMVTRSIKNGGCRWLLK